MELLGLESFPDPGARLGSGSPLGESAMDATSDLVRHVGRLLPHQALLERVWGAEYGATPEYLKVFISRLRAKIEPAGGRRYIASAGWAIGSCGRQGGRPGGGQRRHDRGVIGAGCARVLSQRRRWPRTAGPPCGGCQRALCGCTLEVGEGLSS
jgi:hypothetical protein